VIVDHEDGDRHAKIVAHVTSGFLPDYRDLSPVQGTP